ncbi:MAG TPA: HAD-IIIA family hydrolase [Verrucomicrobiae bacterium]|nr:HAD-IIIA family hydrolase [Verrucomicrobiae bacterium]
MRRAVFFDRDGVLNEAPVRDGVPHPPASLAALRFVDGAEAAVRAVHEAGFLALVVTNQPDVARGTASRTSVEAIDEAVAQRLRLDGVYACFHDDADACECRKPKPGLLLRAADEWKLDLAASYLIGDRVKDVACGRAAGCTTIFIDRGYAETTASPGADASVATLTQAVAIVVERARAQGARA